jgi:hypothetical protein
MAGGPSEQKQYEINGHEMVTTDRVDYVNNIRVDFEIETLHPPRSEHQSLGAISHV